jgi:hypothetical protein
MPDQPFQALLGIACLLAGFGLGSFTTWWRVGRRARRDYRAGCRDTDRLWVHRIVQDRRDDTPLSKPVSR